MGAVTLGIEAWCGINVRDMMERTLYDIFWGISIMVAWTCKKGEKKDLRNLMGTNAKQTESSSISR